MEDLVGRIDLPVDEVGVEDRARNEPHVRVEVRGPTGREVVEHRHISAFGNQRVDEVRSDETGASRDERAHGFRVGHRRLRSRRAPISTRSDLDALSHRYRALPCLTGSASFA